MSLDKIYKFQNGSGSGAFTIGKPIKSGCYGDVLEALVCSCEEKVEKCVIKFNKNVVDHKREVKILTNMSDYENFPNMLDHGEIDGKSYIVMERFGTSLTSHLQENNKRELLSIESTTLIGVQVLKLLEQLHEAGYVHGDLKPDNICVGSYANNY
tara:strand:+ start:199 stop:663 length:465 start_codon:yes stop_codon:yes gene_type:complete